MYRGLLLQPSLCNQIVQRGLVAICFGSTLGECFIHLRVVLAASCMRLFVPWDVAVIDIIRLRNVA